MRRDDGDPSGNSRLYGRTLFPLGQGLNPCPNRLELSSIQAKVRMFDL